MARREERHWWYTGMRRVALAVLEEHLGRHDLKLLEHVVDTVLWQLGV